ncbi:MAG: hypothetical protein A2023_06375 [Sulfuricurvum sp. GWF2_44_89]|uniref:Uncharacterized protein n=1 Tax=Sulfuricurvum kujiense TaxID=148813 RepID=A0A2D3WDU7_9BACT|nr:MULTISPECIES: hypothetical protein [Sulfuricurvum]OHD78670.1 MAG: hypothetical protein A2023_06375 [Sulfuricurvum sp. GWF2_44_89]OHD95300.1 MAG: hypothetical protein A2517_02260 [Sulfuricurvum sp. RIFOXYD12_FULL_44_77]OHD96147.1 MAG: hypothetical protein A2552_08440 [Sulfuricurvum sp. RIFOXYD2_FULL_44_160]DAB39481.1 MAG TPA: hypothetical protein CFH83_00520 [Sulfuricurvum kujiense]
MISVDLLLIIIAMSLLFLRHTAVYKDPSKINYTPVVFALGFIGALLHFILSPAIDMSLIKESLLSLSVGILLSSIMSIMNQTVSVINTHTDRLRLTEITDEITSLSASVTILKDRLELITQMEGSTHDQIRHVFKEEFDALGVIQTNQKHFISKIESLLAQQQSAMGKFEEFTLSELPSLDNVVHRHIDLLRVAEQDHFNHLKTIVRESSEDQKELRTQIQELHNLVIQLSHHQNPDHTITVLQKELDRIVHDFSHHLQTLGAKSESIVTSLLENDSLLRGSREQSELIMQQMVLSSKQMREMTSHSKELSDSLVPLSRLFSSAETLHKEFVLAKGKLSELIVTLESYERHEYRAIRQSLEEVAAEATAQMQLFVQTLQTKESHPLIEAKSVQELASKVKLHKSYLGENQE